MLESLHGRPRGRRLARVLDAIGDPDGATAPAPPSAASAAPPAVPEPVEAAPPPLPILDRPPPPGYRGPSFGIVGEALWARVPPGTEEALYARVDDAVRAVWDTADGASRTFVGLPIALVHEAPGVEEATGLSAVMPPPEVHAMAHDWIATGGAVGYADLVAGALADVGAPLRGGQSVLDFGCSSGRVIRVLHAYEPELRCLGCDPNAPAIDWAREHLPGIDFFVSPTTPPLSLEDASLDAAFAISIWSHFDADAALAWFAEMARVIRPGGHLLVTTQGWQSVAYFARVPGNEVEHQRPLAHALYTDGFVFVDVFGEDGDWGVPSDNWGMGFMTAEWLAAAITPQWSIQLGRSGAIEGNQDLFVLRREGD